MRTALHWLGHVHRGVFVSKNEICSVQYVVKWLAYVVFARSNKHAWLVRNSIVTVFILLVITVYPKYSNVQKYFLYILYFTSDFLSFFFLFIFKLSYSSPGFLKLFESISLDISCLFIHSQSNSGTFHFQRNFVFVETLNTDLWVT